MSDLLKDALTGGSEYSPSLIENLRLSQDELEAAIADEFALVLDNPQRKTLAEGFSLLIEHQPVEGIWLVHHGDVRLFRMIDGEEIVFHLRTVGPVIGLLALALHGKASYNAVASSEVEASYISFTDLDEALKKSARLQGFLTALLIHSFATRQLRSAELNVEVVQLNRALQKERDHLAQVLRDLRNTQTRLVESEKMATLGQLSAGVAHDLNNPVSAIQRSTEYLMDDLESLAPQLENGELFHAVLDKSIHRGFVSTREERDARGVLEAKVGDAGLAKRLIKAGVLSAEDYDSYFNSLKGNALEQCMLTVEFAARVGGSIRNMRSCSGRIIDLVKSLKAYARADLECQVDCDLNQCLSDTLLLFEHALRGVELIKTFGELPRIDCYSGELNQVWTNLISNALEAMESDGILEIRSESYPNGGVAIHIIDNGPGIPEDKIDKIFDLHFSTKKGQVNFGMGIGLSICKQIVSRNGGHIDVESRPGYTAFVVVLPPKPPARSRSTAVVQEA